MSQAEQNQEAPIYIYEGRSIIWTVFTIRTLCARTFRSIESLGLLHSENQLHLWSRNPSISKFREINIMCQVLNMCYLNTEDSWSLHMQGGAQGQLGTVTKYLLPRRRHIGTRYKHSLLGILQGVPQSIRRIGHVILFLCVGCIRLVVGYMPSGWRCEMLR